MDNRRLGYSGPKLRVLRLESLEERRLLAADFGDAPNPYPTLLVADGARHEAVGPTLGASRDTEANGEASVNADGDGSDENGVSIPDLAAGQRGASAVVIVQNAPSGATLNAWLDFNQDGSWGGAGEQIAIDLPVTNGSNAVVFDVPVEAPSGGTYARFRLSTAGGLSPKGVAADGEVEDYRLTINAPRASTGDFVFGGEFNALYDDATALKAADVDSDGDTDFVMTWRGGNESVNWWENVGGEFTHREVDTTINSGGALTGVVADLDGDSDLDIVAATTAGRIIWYENTSGTFASRTVALISNVTMLEAADADADGDMDLYLSSSTSGTVEWLENNGSQVFTRRSVAMGVPGIRHIEVVDFDRDGDLDVVSGRSNPRAVSWFENVGSQVFVTRNGVSTAPAAKVVDLDRDGDMDVLSADGDAIFWFVNAGPDESYSAWLGEHAFDADSVEAVDMDGDGDLDVVTTATGLGKIFWYENDGSGFFTSPWERHEVGVLGDRGRRLAVADIDQDGDMDVAGLSYLSRSVKWYENVGAAVSVSTETPAIAEHSDSSSTIIFRRRGDLSEPLTTSFTLSGTATMGVDFGLTGAQFVSATGGTIVIAAGEATAELRLTPIRDQIVEFNEQVIVGVLPGADSLVESPTLAFVTLHDPGDYGDAPAPYPTLLERNGAQHMGGGPRLGFDRDNEFNGTPHPGAVGDDNVTRDDEDGVVFGPMRVGQLEAWVEVDVQSTSTTARIDAWIDFNGDGFWGGDGEQIADSAVVSHGTQILRFALPSSASSGGTYARVRISQNGGLGPGGLATSGEVEDQLVMISPPVASSGEFGEQQIISPRIWGSTSVHAADIDSDGDMDVLAAPINQHTIGWYENDGSENFTERIISDTIEWPYFVQSVDIDLDGDIDILAGYDDWLLWHENNGNQEFTQHTIGEFPGNFSVSVQPRSAVPTDVDQDGDLDFVFSLNVGFNNGITNGWGGWFDNIGDGTFTRHYFAHEADAVTGVAVGDIDRDGDVDFVLGSDRYLYWYENDGTRELLPRHEVTSSRGNFSAVSLADMNGDGDLDIVATDLYDDSVGWYDNIGTDFSWTVVPISGNTTWPVALHVADLDGDGDVDVLTGSDQITAHFLEDGSWVSSHTITDQVLSTHSLFAADMDSDGDLDVLSASRDNGRVAWYENLASALTPGDYDHNGLVNNEDYEHWRSTFDSFGGTADGNGNGVVDASDYVVWRKMAGTNGSPAFSRADGNGEMKIDQDDDSMWSARIGMTVPSSGAASAGAMPMHGAPKGLAREEPTMWLSTDSTAENDARAAFSAGFELLGNPTGVQDFSVGSQGRIDRYHHAESRSDDLLLLANDRVWRRARSGMTVVEDHSRGDVHAYELDSKLLIDESLVVALAEWQ